MDELRSNKKVKRIVWNNAAETVAAKAHESNENGKSPTEIQDKLNKKHRFDPLQVSSSLRTCSSNGPCIMPLLPIPNVEEWSSKASVVLSGTARKAGVGPSLGAVDIGISKYAYFFQVALPGVKKDPGHLNCEIEHAGMVHVRGETSTGGNTVSRNSRVFKMKLQQQPPPGPFTLSFSLPGPVDPRLFHLNFRSDGILEGIVVKNE